MTWLLASKLLELLRRTVLVSAELPFVRLPNKANLTRDITEVSPMGRIRQEVE